jgi:large subunit ribosomal protein L4
MPKKMRRLALRCVLSAKASKGELMVVDRFPLEQPKTKEMARILKALGADSSALIVTHEPETNVVRSAHNLEGVKTLPAALLNVGDLLSHRELIMTVPAVRRAEQLWGRA